MRDDRSSHPRRVVLIFVPLSCPRKPSSAGGGRVGMALAWGPLSGGPSPDLSTLTPSLYSSVLKLTV